MKFGMIIAVFMGMSIAKNKDVMRIIMRFWFTLCLKSSLLSIIVANMESGARILPNKVTFAIAIKKFEYVWAQLNSGTNSRTVSHWKANKNMRKKSMSVACVFSKFCFMMNVVEQMYAMEKNNSMMTAVELFVKRNCLGMFVR